MKGLKGLFNSKKFLAAVGAVLAALAMQFIGLEEGKADMLSQLVVGIGAAVVAGQAASDAFGKGKVEAEAEKAVSGE